MKFPLYLASSSHSRQELLTFSNIPFSVIEQTASEKIPQSMTDPKAIVQTIAREKMDHARLANTLYTLCCVLTADTVCISSTGTIVGKPKDFNDARSMLREWRNGCTVVTGFCLEKKELKNSRWITLECIEQQIETALEIDISDYWLELYLNQPDMLSVAGAMKIEGFGMQFIKTINGSYSNVIGLPLNEVRIALEKIGFFK